MNTSQDQAYTMLLRLLRVEPVNDLDLSRLSAADWEETLRTARSHGITPLLNQRCSSLQPIPPIPDETRIRLKQSSISIGFRNTKLYHELEKVLWRLASENIPVIVLKGAHLAELVYKNIALRPMDDIDILVHRQHLDKVRDVLFDLGYVHLEAKSIVTSPHHLAPFVKPGEVAVEVHWTIPLSDVFRMDMDGIWERARSVTISGVETRVLCPEDLLLHLCLHASVHHRFGIGLRPLCDIVETVRCYQGELNWNKFQERAQVWGATTAVYLTLLVAVELLGAAVPATTLEQMKPQRFDARLLEWAKSQVFIRSEELRDNTAMSPRLAGFWQTSFLSKTRLLVQVAFPPLDELARIYHVPSGSKRLWFYYPVRLKDLVTARGKAALRLARGDKDALVSAEMLRQLLGNTRSD